MRDCSQHLQPQLHQRSTYVVIEKPDDSGKINQQQLAEWNCWNLGDAGSVACAHGMLLIDHARTTPGYRPCNYDGNCPCVGSSEAEPRGEEPSAPRLLGKLREAYDDNDNHDNRTVLSVMDASADAQLQSYNWQPREYDPVESDPALLHELQADITQAMCHYNVKQLEMSS